MEAIRTIGRVSTIGAFRTLHLIVLAVLAGLAQSDPAGASEAESQWRSAIEAVILEHPALVDAKPVVELSSSLPRWPRCTAPKAQVIRQGVPVGRVSVALRCQEPRWQGTVQVFVAAKRTHLAAARALQAGATLEPGELITVESDWGAVPDDVATDQDQLIGRTLIRSVSAGTPLTLNLVRATSVIRTGERVRVQLSGTNFQVAGEGQALQQGGIGDQVRVKMGSGQTVTAIVVRQGLVEVKVD